MKYLKTYEELDTYGPKVGDWVICELIEFNADPELKEFINNRIGKLVDIDLEFHEKPFHYFIQYEKNIPKDIEEEEYLVPHKIWNNTINFSREEIKFWAKTKKDLKLKAEMGKYNL